MDRTLTLRYDDRVVRAGLRRYLGRQLGWTFRVAVVVAAAALAVLAYRSGDSWYTLVVGAIVLLSLLVPLIVYGVMLPLLTRRFRRIYGDEARFHFTDRTLGVRTHAHTGQTPWSGLTRLWRFPEAWLLFTGKDSFTLLPAEDLPEDVRRHIVNQVTKNGGEVV